jgi:hypothetical protein
VNRIEFTDAMGPFEWLELFRDRMAKYHEAAAFSGREVAHIVAAARVLPVSEWPITAGTMTNPEGAK